VVAQDGKGGRSVVAQGGKGGATKTDVGGTTTAGAGGEVGEGKCCPDGKCICRGEDPKESSAQNGPYKTDKYEMPNPTGYGAGTVYYPTDAKPPFSGAVIFAPFMVAMNVSLAKWGPFLASWGIVLQTTDAFTTSDPVDTRATELAAAIKQFRGENTRQNSPLFGKMSDRVGSMGYSMGGGANWIVASQDPTLKSSISLAGHNMTSVTAQTCSSKTTVPSMQLNGAQDTSILGGMGQSDGVYAAIPDSTPKLIYVTSNAGHMTFGGPTDASEDVGKFVLAFQKTFLDGDTRWKKFLLVKPTDATTYETNIK
jgi:hypothetical protein